MNWYLVGTWNRIQDIGNSYSLQAHTAEDALTTMRLHLNKSCIVGPKGLEPIEEVRSIYSIPTKHPHTEVVGPPRYAHQDHVE